MKQNRRKPHASKSSLNQKTKNIVPKILCFRFEFLVFKVGSVSIQLTNAGCLNCKLLLSACIVISSTKRNSQITLQQKHVENTGY